MNKLNFVMLRHSCLVLVVSYSLIYLAFGVLNELILIKQLSLPNSLMFDYGIYERALVSAIKEHDPYEIRTIGLAFLYPPPALFVIEPFNLIRPFAIKAAIYMMFNVILLILIVYGISNYYNYKSDQIWYWYFLCLGFSPFIGLLHVGQINVITLSGIFLFFIYAERHSLLGSAGLALSVFTKVSPVSFFLYIVASKNWRTFFATIFIILSLLGLSILRYGMDPVLKYPSVLQRLSSRFIFHPTSQALVSNLAKIFGDEVIQPRASLIQIILVVWVILVSCASAWMLFVGKSEREPLFIITCIGMTLSPNIMWYHHYVFLLLPLLIWMGWSRLDRYVVLWCLLGFLTIQVDKHLLTSGILIHVFGHISILMLLYQQFRVLFVPRNMLKKYFRGKSGVLLQKWNCPTMRTADGGYAARYFGFFLALGFSPFRGRVHAPTHRS